MTATLAVSRPAEQRAPLSVVWQSRWGLPIGYALTSEAMALALDARGVRVMHRPTPWHMPARIQNERLRALAAHPIDPFAPQVSYDQADLFDAGHPGYKIGFTMLEVDGLPTDWVTQCNRMDEIWTPSSWGAETFELSGVRRPIHVMPLGYDPQQFNMDIPARRASERFTFVSVFEWGERKGPDVLLRAYTRAFRRRDDVLLILRINNFDGNVDVAQQIAALRLPSDAPPIAILYNQQLDGLGELFRSADCLVLPTRGEGWGMPILEAMACGLPVIATNWSAQTDFFHAGVGFPLNVRALVPADAKCPFYLGWRWAEPDGDHLVELMRYVASNPADARRRGLLAAQEARERWTWAHTAARIERRLRELEPQA